MRGVVLSLVFALCLSAPVYALSSGQTISSVTRINLNDEIIIGERAEYTLELPQMWYSGYLIADRTKSTANDAFLEKITFSYLPQNKSSKPVAFANFYVYDYHISLDPYGPRKVLETNLYTFAVESTKFNGFMDKVDKSLFDIFLSNANDDEWFAGMIKIPKNQVRIVSDTVTVNKTRLTNPSMQNSLGVVYIPVREACTALGYKVGWRASDRTVVLVRGNEYHTLSTGANDKSPYSTIIVSDMAYVSSIFFIRELNASIEVDNYNNVVISAAAE